MPFSSFLLTIISKASIVDVLKVVLLNIYLKLRIFNCKWFFFSSCGNMTDVAKVLKIILHFQVPWATKQNKAFVRGMLALPGSTRLLDAPGCPCIWWPHPLVHHPGRWYLSSDLFLPWGFVSPFSLLQLPEELCASPALFMSGWGLCFIEASSPGFGSSPNFRI